MQDAVRTFRVSPAYVKCLWQQAIFSGLGILGSWSLFLVVSLELKPAIPMDELWRLPLRLLTDSKLWMMPTPDEIRELIRFGIGPAFAFCALLGGLADISSWNSVRYEIHPDTLRMCWRRLWRQVAWDLIQSVDERPHTRSVLCSLKITQRGAQPILVRGLESMPEFVELLRSRLPRLAKWSISGGRIDLTGRITNFVAGFLLLVPLSATWMAYYAIGWHSIALIWSVVLLPVAYWLWVQQPMSRSHVCVREVEMLMVFLLVILSGALTGISWMDSSTPFPAIISRWLGW